MKGKQKILFYISTIRGGGAARVMVNIANGLCEKGYSICLVTNFCGEHEYQLSDGVTRINFEKDEMKGNVLVRNYTRISKLRKVIKNEKPAVCIAFMGENNYRLILSSIGLKVKTIVSVRNDPNREYGQGRKRVLANLIFSKADGIVFQTKDAMDFFSTNNQHKSIIILNQVDEKFFRKKNNIGEYIVACGRLSKQKNYPLLIHAFARVLKELPNEILRIYGEGELKYELSSLVKKLGIEESVQFMGFSNDMADVYQNAKVLVLSSDYEGMPNAMLEALASSVPVIATDCPCGGPKMIIQNGENGFLVPVGDDKELAGVIVSLLRNEELMNIMSDKAFIMAENYSPHAILQQWEKYIHDVISDD